MTPVATAAGLLRRFLDRHGHRRVFRPTDDLDVFHKWLRTTDLAGEWRGCRALAGQCTDSGLLAAVQHEHPELITDFTDRRPMQNTGPTLIRDINRPTPAELTAVRLAGISMIAAVLRDDLATVYRLSPKSAGDAAYATVALAELAADLIIATGGDPVEVVEDLRGATIRNQAAGGRA